METMKSAPSDNTGNMLVLLTRACQLRCVYCSMDKYDPKPMSFEMFQQAVRLLMSSDHESVELQFFGGDPLIMPEMVRRGILHAEGEAARVKKKFRPVVTTNGLRLDDAMIDFLMAHKGRVFLSMDGAPVTQKKIRPAFGKADEDLPLRTREALARLVKKGADFFVNMVVGPKEVPQLLENVRHIADLGAKDIQIGYALGEYWGPEDSEALARAILEVIAYAHRRSRQGAALRILNLHNDSEPTLGHPQVVVDCDGIVDVGCSIVIENTLPDLARVFTHGPIAGVSGMRELRRSREEQRLHIDHELRDAHERVIVNSNLKLGNRLRGLFERARGGIFQGASA